MLKTLPKATNAVEKHVVSKDLYILNHHTKGTAVYCIMTKLVISMRVLMVQLLGNFAIFPSIFLV